ncbi:MAG: 2Fe-2S iron-sulfur cluster-binding protein [Bacteroidota bacterium]
MAKITFITQSGEQLTFEGESGSIMELAVQNDISGIDGDCGGVCSCATCHVHVDPTYFPQTGEAEEIEKDMLELAENVQPTSRLCCQLEIKEELDGIILTVANE